MTYSPVRMVQPPAPMPVLSMTWLLKRFFCSIYSEQVKLIKGPASGSRRLDFSAARVQEASPNCPGLDSRAHSPQSQSVAYHVVVDGSKP